jgi:phosphoserine aminotransferase
MKKHNFFAGPAILPESVILKASEQVKMLNESGLSLIEISHRSKPFIEIMDNAKNLVAELYGLRGDFEVLFIQGGASLQFCMVPYNLLKPDGKAAYIDSGSWAAKAIKEAKLFGGVEVLGSSKESNYDHIPKLPDVLDNYDYLHITSNNTISGTEINYLEDYLAPAFDTNIPVVADMSSDIFSKPIDANKFGIIYAGAQKNLGPAGTTMVIINKSILKDTGRPIPTMLNYNTHIDKGSMFNTPPVFAIYTSMLTLEWIKEKGGLVEMEKKNIEKATLLYNEIDNNPLFKGISAKDDRSRMNVTFEITNSDLEGKFLTMCEDAGIMGIKGHRSVGGFRASIYNAMEINSVKVLVEIMKELANKNG